MHSSIRDGGKVLVDQLEIHGVRNVFCVPGESYLAVLNALHDSPISVTICRQEGGAAMMADATGKLTGRPGICFVTRGPGATNAAAGVHIAMQDSTPMILFIGQVERGMRGREAFQEIDYRAMFGGVAKWATEIDDAARIPEIVARAFAVASSGRPGPVVVSLPEDMLTDHVVAADAKPFVVPESQPRPDDLAKVQQKLMAAERPLLILGGTRWDEAGVAAIIDISERLSVPVAVSFRRQALFPADHPHFVGDLGVGSNTKLVEYARTADVVALVGGRLSELPSQGYTLLRVPVPATDFIHVHPGAEEIGHVYQPDVGINTSPAAFAAALSELEGECPGKRADRIQALREEFLEWSEPKPRDTRRVDMNTVMQIVRNSLPAESVICNGAGNYATWVHRFYHFTRFGTQLAPTSGSMGYGVPAAVAAARRDRSVPAVAFAGDGCFLMHGQEFATAVQYNLPIVVIVVDNGMYGTIRMHQEREYPGRVSGTALVNPDFAAYATAFGGHGERVETTAEFAPALERARASGKPAILHCLVDPEAITINSSISTIREKALERVAASH